MPTYEEIMPLIARHDLGYAYLLMMVATITAIGLYLSSRRAWFRSVVKWSAPVMVPLAVTLFNPLAGAATAMAALATRIRVNLSNPLSYILALAAIVRIPALFDSLWYDESFTNVMIHMPDFRSFWPAIMADVHPPLYYLLLQPFATLTDNPALLRVTSVVIGLWGIVLVWRLVQALDLGQRTAIVTALLWAVMPSHIYYSTELRVYILMVNFAVAMMLAIIQDRPKRWIIWTAAICWVHNAGMFYAAVFGLATLLWHGRSWLKPVIIASVISAVWLPFMFSQAHNVSEGHWAYINFGMVFWPLVTMTVGNQGPYSGIMVTAIAAVTMVSFWHLRRFWPSRAGMLLLAGIFAVPVIEVVLSLVWRPTYIWRHMLPNMLLLAIPWAWLIVHSRTTRLVMGATMMAGFMSLWGWWYPHARPDHQTFIAESCGDATAIYATSINAAFIASENSDIPVYVWPGARDNGRSVRIEDMGKFGYSLTPLPSGDVCILEIEIPHRFLEEREFLQTIGAEMVATEEIGNWHIYHAWMLSERQQIAGADGP